MIPCLIADGPYCAERGDGPVTPPPIGRMPVGGRRGAAYPGPNAADATWVRRCCTMADRSSPPAAPDRFLVGLVIGALALVVLGIAAVLIGPPGAPPPPPPGSPV